MVRALVVAMSMSLLASSSLAQTPKPSSDVEKEIRKLEEQERDATLRGDVAVLEKLWAKELVVSAPSNSVRSGSELLELVKAGKVKYQSFDRTIERVSVQGDIVIAMGHERVVPMMGPESGTTVTRRFSNIWAKQDGQWRLVARQSTIVGSGR